MVKIRVVEIKRTDSRQATSWNGPTQILHILPDTLFQFPATSGFKDTNGVCNLCITNCNTSDTMVHFLWFSRETPDRAV